MATYSMNADLYRTDTSSRIKLASLRGTHRNVEEYANVAVKLAPGEDGNYEVSNFFYAFFKTTMDVVEVTVGDNTIALTNLIGVVCFPFPCSVDISVPSDSENRALRELEVWFS